MRLQPTLRECALPREPFVRLIEANRVDQRVSRYETWEQLRGYCALSADPVGELVLRRVRRWPRPSAIALSDAICTALQLAEHCQDVAEDLRARARLPAGRGPRALRLHERGPAAPSTPASRCAALIAFEVARARELLAAGRAADRDAARARRGWRSRRSSPAAARRCDAIERAGYDVLAGPRRARAPRRRRARSHAP